MEPAGAAASIACAVAIVALAPVVVRAWRRGDPRADVCALSLAVAAVALLGAFIAQIAGASRFDTGRFLIGMSAGVAVGLTLGCAVLLIARPSQPGG
ncbi:MAG TPA: hypothetical protein VFQ25_01155 [Ktedonobacterales bacterium]|nr:hypothetical protein [Ktedonobacterales bacterium]